VKEGNIKTQGDTTMSQKTEGQREQKHPNFLMLFFEEPNSSSRVHFEGKYRLFVKTAAEKLEQLVTAQADTSRKIDSRRFIELTLLALRDAARIHDDCSQTIYARKDEGGGSESTSAEFCGYKITHLSEVRIQ
jgi:hypothetical protein